MKPREPQLRGLVRVHGFYAAPERRKGHARFRRYTGPRQVPALGRVGHPPDETKKLYVAFFKFRIEARGFPYGTFDTPGELRGAFRRFFRLRVPPNPPDHSCVHKERMKGQSLSILGIQPIKGFHLLAHDHRVGRQRVVARRPSPEPAGVGQYVRQRLEIDVRRRDSFRIPRPCRGSPCGSGPVPCGSSSSHVLHLVFSIVRFSRSGYPRHLKTYALKER